MQVVDIDIVVGKNEAGKWRQTGTRTIRALCDDIWAIHPAMPVFSDDYEPLFRLTHRPTGFAARTGMTWDVALETLREIRSRNVDWTFTDPAAAKALNKEWRSIKAAVEAKLHPPSEPSLELEMASGTVDRGV